MKIIFIINDLSGHGVTTSLINLFKALCGEGLDISLLVFLIDEESQIDKIPPYVKIMQNDKGLASFSKKASVSLRELLRAGEWRLLLLRALVFLKGIHLGRLKALQKYWRKIING